MFSNIKMHFLMMLVFIFYFDTTHAQNYEIRNGHFPNGKVVSSDIRLVVENLPSHFLIKLKDGYHVQYGGDFIGDKKVSSVAGERVINGEFLDDKTADGYFVFLSGIPEAEDHKIVIIKPSLDSLGQIHYQPNGSLFADKISPADNPIIEFKQINGSIYSGESKEIISATTTNISDLATVDCPIHIKTSNGYLFCVSRYSVRTESGKKFMGFLLAVSADNGNSLERTIRIDADKYGFRTGNYPELVFEESTQTLFLFSDNQYITSTDYGKSFNKAQTVNIDTSDFPMDNDCYRQVMTAGGNGIVLSNGTICIPMNVLQKWKQEGVDTNNNYHEAHEVKTAQCFILYSSDNGNSWSQSPTTTIDVIAWEFSIAEYKRNRIMLNARGGTEENWKRTANGRRVFVSRTSGYGKNWKLKKWLLRSKYDGVLWDPICNASFVVAKLNGKKMGLFANPFIPGRYMPRTNLTLQVTANYKKWEPAVMVTGPYDITQGYTSVDCHNNIVTMVYCDYLSKRIMYVNLSQKTDEIMKAYKKSRKLFF